MNLNLFGMAHLAKLVLWQLLSGTVLLAQHAWLHMHLNLFGMVLHAKLVLQRLLLGAVQSAYLVLQQLLSGTAQSAKHVHQERHMIRLWAIVNATTRKKLVQMVNVL